MIIELPSLAEHDPVAVSPDAGVGVEVGGAVRASRRGRSRSATGIDGIGWRITSSPSSPTTGSPSGVERRRRRRPGSAPTSRPRRPAAADTPGRCPVQTSVPPLPRLSSTLRLELLGRATRTRPAASGEPAAPIVRIDERSNRRPGSSPSLRHAIANAGLTPEHRRPRLLGEPPLVRRGRGSRDCRRSSRSTRAGAASRRARSTSSRRSS